MATAAILRWSRLPSPLPATPIGGAKPHLVIVVFESTRADVLGKRIDGKPVAPNLARVAAQGGALAPASLVLGGAPPIDSPPGTLDMHAHHDQRDQRQISAQRACTGHAPQRPNWHRAHGAHIVSVRV